MTETPAGEGPGTAASAQPVAVIGGGPAGLMAAEVLAAAGMPVALYDAMPSPGRKLLLAGRGGLNLTHSEPFDDFAARFDAGRSAIEPALRAFGPDDVRAWAAGLGIETFIGTSGRVFPRDMKAAPLLRAWLKRLRAAGVHLHTRHRWQGGGPDALRFTTPAGPATVAARAVVFALGGASWPRLGSDGAWQAPLQALGAEIAPLRPANCGFDIGWSPYFAERFAGRPFKPVVLRFTGADGRSFARRGEFVATATGIEGSLVYACAAQLRDEIAAHGSATVHLDLLPDRSASQVEAALRERGKRSLASHLKTALKLDALKCALLHELLPRDALADPACVAGVLKAAPLVLRAPRPVAEAISTAGGVRFASLDAHLMLRGAPGVFVAGEMLDWEAPTGGYLLTATLATGVAAARGALRWLARGAP